MPKTLPESPHGKAQRLAKYGHKCWIVWREAGETIAEQATPDSLRRAIAATGTGKFHGYSRSTGQGMILGPGVAQAWLSNAEAGLLNS